MCTVCVIFYPIVEPFQCHLCQIAMLNYNIYTFCLISLGWVPHAFIWCTYDLYEHKHIRGSDKKCVLTFLFHFLNFENVTDLCRKGNGLGVENQINDTDLGRKMARIYVENDTDYVEKGTKLRGSINNIVNDVYIRKSRPTVTPLL